VKSDGTETDSLNKGTAPSPQTQAVSAQANTPESVPTASEPISLLVRVLERDNVQQALNRVRERNDTPGIDGMTANALPEYLKEHWSVLRAKLATGTYRPQPMQRVEMPGADGKIRLLAVPTMVDRFIQQAIVQVVEAQWKSEGESFQPRNSANRIVRELDILLQNGDRWVLPPKIERFFDKTQHDRLVARLGRRLPDRDLLRLVNRFIKVSRQIHGESEQANTGVPRLGPLTQILALVVLEQLDKEFNRRSARRSAEQNANINILAKGQQAARYAIQSLTGRFSKQEQASDTAQTGEPEPHFQGQPIHSGPTLLTAPLPWLKAYFGIGEASHHRSYLDVTLVISLFIHAAVLLIQFGVPGVNLPNFVAAMDNAFEARQEIRVQLARIDPEPTLPKAIDLTKKPAQVKPRKDTKNLPSPVVKAPDPKAPLPPTVQVDDDMEPAGEGPRPLPGRPTMKTRVLTMVGDNASDFMLPPLEVKDSRRPADDQVLRQARELEAKNKADLIAKQKAAALALRLEEKKRRAEEKAKRLALALEAKQQAELLAQQKAAELALLKLQREEERKQLALKKLAEEAEKRELEAAQLKEKKRQEAEDLKRLALELEAKKQAELAEKQRLDEELAKRLAAELEAKKQAELIAQQKAVELARLKAQQEEEQRQLALKKQAEDEARRLAQEAARLKEKQRLDEELARRLAAELEAKKQAELIAQQKAAELARLKAQQEEEQRQLALKKQAEDEARRLAQEAARLKDKQRLEEELARRLAAELEARKQAELIAQQKAAELARLKAQQEEEQRQLALRKQAEDEARRLAQEAARLKEKQRLEEELARRLAAELEARKQAELIAQQKAAELARLKAQQEEEQRQLALKKQAEEAARREQEVAKLREKQRQEEELARRKAQEAEERRQAEVLAQQKAAELARKKLEQEQAERQARLAEEQRLAQQERDRQYALKLAAQKLAEEAARIEREAAIQRENKRLEEERAQRQREEQARRAEEERLRKLEEDRIRRLQEENARRLEEERARRAAEERAKRKQEELERQQEADRIRRLERQKEAEEENLKFLKKNQGKGTWVY
jgi:retron-type reverse transcriptase